MKKDKAKKIVMKTVLGFACLAAAFGITSNVALLRAGANGGERTVASYFEAGNGVEFATNVNTPSYVANSRNGVMVESTEGGILTYNNLINVESLSKDDLLFEIQYTPETLGVYEFKQLVVRLEDSVDSKNYVEISLYRYPWSDNSHKKLTYVTVKTNTIAAYKSVHYKTPKSTTAPEGSNPYSATAVVQSNVSQGTMVYGSFIGANGTISDSVSVYYDNTERALYTQNLSCWPRTEEELKNPQDATYRKDVLQKTGKVDENGKALVLDLDDPAHMGIQKSNLWTGFPSGKAKLSVRTAELTEDTARYMLLTLDNQSLDGMLINDKTAPELDVDLEGYAENELPNAKVGKYYPFFKATATDKMYGDVLVSKHVYKDGQEIFFTGDGFVPSQAGEYYVDYIAYDGSGNKTSKRFSVTAKTLLTDIKTSFVESETALPLWDETKMNENGNFTAALYYPVTLPEIKGESEGGKVSTNKEVFYNGNKIQLEKNVFCPERKGEYEIVYTLTDYIGSIKEVRYTVEIAYSDLPMLEKPVLPDYLVEGKVYKFPAVQSQLYAVWRQSLETYDTITLYKEDGKTVIKTFANGEIAAYTPTAADVGKMIVEYKTAASETSPCVSYTKELTVLPFETLKDLFVVDEGASITPTTSDLEFVFTEAGQSVEFVNAVSVHGGLTITFKIPQSANNFSAVEFVFRDKQKAENYIVVTIEKAALIDPNNPPTVSYLAVNGGAKAALNASFYGNVIDDFLFTLTADGSVYNYNDDLLAKAEDFEGFSSGFVYMTFTAVGVEADSAVALKKIRNQTMFDDSEDFIKPVLTVFEEPVGQVDLNERVFLSGAVASDIFDGNAKLTVTITLKGKEIFYAEDKFGAFDGCYFQPTQYGTYILQYFAEDATGNFSMKKCNIVVRDRVAPVIQLQGEMPKAGSVGKALALPKAIAMDNADWDLQVYVIVIDPMNVFTLIPVGEDYIPKYEGRYIVKYYCEDKNYNTTYLGDYVVTVGG